MQDDKAVFRTIFFRCLKELYSFDFDYGESISSEVNYLALQKMFSEITRLRNKSENLGKVRLEQGEFVKNNLIKDSVIVRKPIQRKLLRVLSSGDCVSILEIKKVILPKDSHVETEAKRRNSISQLVSELVKTLNNGNDYFVAKIRSDGRGKTLRYQLTIEGKDILGVLIYKRVKRKDKGSIR